MTEKSPMQQREDLLTTLVGKVDALTRASLDLALLRRDAQSRKAAAVMNERRDAAVTAKTGNIETMSRSIEARIRELRTRLDFDIIAVGEVTDKELERIENDNAARMAALEKEHAIFVERVTANHQRYVSYLEKAELAELQRAVKMFNTDVSSWILPEG
jgi:hypothetical protein